MNKTMIFHNLLSFYYKFFGEYQCTTLQYSTLLDGKKKTIVQTHDQLRLVKGREQTILLWLGGVNQRDQLRLVKELVDTIVQAHDQLRLVKGREQTILLWLGGVHQRDQLRLVKELVDMIVQTHDQLRLVKGREQTILLWLKGRRQFRPTTNSGW